jgi:hypothetical protein
MPTKAVASIPVYPLRNKPVIELPGGTVTATNSRSPPCVVANKSLLPGVSVRAVGVGPLPERSPWVASFQMVAPVAYDASNTLATMAKSRDLCVENIGWVPKTVCECVCTTTRIETGEWCVKKIATAENQAS